VFAQRILAEGGKDDAAKVGFAFRMVAGRAPTGVEQARLLDFVRQQTKSFSREPDAAQALVRVGSAPIPAGVDPRRLAPWMMLGNVLFNLDETLTK
jgi:hypothetical protein